MNMSQSYDVNTFRQGIEQLHVDDIQHDKQGNIIYNQFEQKERNHEHWQDLEKEYSINFGDVVKIGDYLGRVQELYVYEGKKENQGVGIKLYGGTEFENIRCKEVGMTTAKEFLKSIKVQPREKEKQLSIKEKIKNTIKTNVQTLKKTLKKGGAAARLANRRTHEKATNAQTKPSASQSASQRLKNKRALQNTQGLER